MADKTPSDSPLAADRLDSKFNAHAGDEHHSWTEGLPHDFTGWGPRTPDPSEDLHVADDGLHWAGEESHRHIVWSFDRKHRHH
jgi:hypothetical protein